MCEDLPSINGDDICINLGTKCCCQPASSIAITTIAITISITTISITTISITTISVTTTTITITIITLRLTLSLTPPPSLATR
jgi:hypothetical protein